MSFMFSTQFFNFRCFTSRPYNNEICNQNVQVKNVLHDWNLLHKETVDTGQSYNKKDKSKNCCDIDHTTQSSYTISNSINKTLMVNSQTKVQNEGSFNESSQVIQLSDQLCQNTNTNECLYNKQNNRLFLESQHDTSEVISELSKTSCLEDGYKNSNIQERNSQPREMNKLEGFLSKDGDTSMGINNNGYNCPTCGKNFKKEQHVIQHLKTHEGKQWECDVCSKMFTTKYFLKKHKRLHSGEMPYKCNICDKTFTFQQSYHKHRLYHKDDKPHMCTTCGRSFKELSTLHNHERIHTGEKPFACETCGKCFRQRVSYLVHRRIHTGVMPYTCTMCGKSFRYKVSQRTHKCPVQQSSAQQQSNEIVQTSAVISIAQENCNEANHLQETNSSQQIKQILNGINNKDNKFVLIINAQGQTVLTRESDLENEEEANFAKTKETNKNSSEDGWNSDNSKNLNSKSSTNHSDKLLSDNRNNVQDTTDFFSLVMSPLENDLSSPTSGMEHLRLSSPISKNISQPLFSNFRHPSENINENIIHTDVEETYTTDDNIRCSFETINEESLKQLLYSIDKK